MQWWKLSRKYPVTCNNLKTYSVSPVQVDSVIQVMTQWLRIQVLDGKLLSFSLRPQVSVTLWDIRNAHALHIPSYTVLGSSVMSFDFCSVGSEMTDEARCLWIPSTKAPTSCTAGMPTSSCRNISDGDRDLWHNVGLHDCATSSGDF